MEKLHGEMPPERFKERQFRCQSCRDTLYVIDEIELLDDGSSRYKSVRCTGGMCPAWVQHRHDVQERVEREGRDKAYYRKQKQEAQDDD